MACKLVIFDCDGVLVDSEVISLSVLRDYIAGLGVHISDDECRNLFLGVSLETTCRVLTDDYGLTLDGDQLAGMRKMLYDRFKQELKAIPDVDQVIPTLDMPFCVASSSQVERIRLALMATGLLPLFDGNIFSATMVENGKPAPDLFLHAAGAMNTAPADCIVIEDSPAGITAAKRAGMKVFAFTGASHAGQEGHATSIKHLEPDATFDKMRQLPALITEFSLGGGANE